MYLKKNPGQLEIVTHKLCTNGNLREKNQLKRHLFDHVVRPKRLLLVCNIIVPTTHTIILIWTDDIGIFSIIINYNKTVRTCTAPSL